MIKTVIYFKILILYLLNVQILLFAHNFEDELNFNFDLPEEQIPFFFHRRPDLFDRCLADDRCPYKNLLNETQSKNSKCFGYEDDCDWRNRSSYNRDRLECPGDSNWYTIKTKDDQMRTFWEQGDFGYVKEHGRSIETICEPRLDSPDESSLICSDHLRYCYGKNVVFDFKNLRSRGNTNKYREDVIQNGDVGGRCRLNSQLLRARIDHHSPLQSWAAELKYFQGSDNFGFSNCDIIYEKPVVLIKLDAGISMYHHFCDFINLYASQHLNGSFHRDVQIIQWDTSGTPYGDFFAETWRAFTDLPLLHLKELDGKKVCFREAMFPLLARMMFGLYYNMPLIGGCQGSGLVHAFSNHILHRLRLSQHGPMANGKLRATFLSRETKYRRILNENELINGLKTMVELEVTKVDYANLPFLLQLNRTLNTDIFIGIHGSGLTHLLFLPDWAAVFEIYNCEDPGCYLDLARLRGVAYFTWERGEKLRAEDRGHHPTLGAHAKFTNYEMDLDEFLRITSKMIRHVRGHRTYAKARAELEEDFDGGDDKNTIRNEL